MPQRRLPLELFWAHPSENRPQLNESFHIVPPRNFVSVMWGQSGTIRITWTSSKTPRGPVSYGKTQKGGKLCPLRQTGRLPLFQSGTDLLYYCLVHSLLQANAQPASDRNPFVSASIAPGYRDTSAWGTCAGELAAPLAQ